MHIRLHSSCGADLGRSIALVTDNIHAIGVVKPHQLPVKLLRLAASLSISCLSEHDLISGLSIWRCPRPFVDILVLVDGASSDQVLVLAEVDKSASIVIDDTTALFPHHPFFSFVACPNFCIDIS